MYRRYIKKFIYLSIYLTHTHTHTHRLNGPLSRTTRVSRHQKSKTNLDFPEARDSEWQWHQLGCVQVCTSLQTTPHHSVFTGRMPFLPPNQQCQSTDGNVSIYLLTHNIVLYRRLYQYRSACCSRWCSAAEEH